MPDGRDCVTLVSVEPRHFVAAIAQRPGTIAAVAVVFLPGEIDELRIAAR